MRIPVAYTLFALFATAVNIGAQEIAGRAYSGAGHLLLSIVTGTMAGLMVKYVLDKRYIFRFQASNALHDGKTFVLYSLMGVVTTVIFWGFEFGFNYAFGTKELRYLGGVLGLAIGYVAKYHLDKQFVFRKEAVS